MLQRGKLGHREYGSKSLSLRLETKQVWVAGYEVCINHERINYPEGVKPQTRLAHPNFLNQFSSDDLHAEKDGEYSLAT